MKVQVIYTSRTGCTKRVAEAICAGVCAEEKSIHDLADGVPVLDGDVILLGYWAIGKGPCREMEDFLKTISGKAVGVFCTLGYYADSAYGFQVAKTGVELLRERNAILGSYVCNGAVAPEMQSGRGGIPASQKELRWEITDSHPTEAECALAAERFRERVTLYRRCREKKIPFESIL